MSRRWVELHLSPEQFKAMQAALLDLDPSWWCSRCGAEHPIDTDRCPCWGESDTEGTE